VEVFSDGRLVCFPTPLPLPLFGSCKRFPTLFLVLCAWHLTSSPLDAHPFPLAGRGGSWNCFGGPSLRLARSKPYVFRVFKKVVEQNWTCGDYFKGVCSQVFCMAFVLLLLYADSLIAFLLCWLVSCSSLLQPEIRRYLILLFIELNIYASMPNLGLTYLTESLSTVLDSAVFLCLDASFFIWMGYDAFMFQSVWSLWQGLLKGLQTFF
jgi:hypothetical protein